MRSTQTKYKYFILTALTFAFSILSFQAHAGGVKIIIVGSDYDRHHSYSGYRSDYGKSHRLRNKHYFDNRYRKSYGNHYYGQRGYRNNYIRNNYRYNNRNYYRNNRSYCPY